MNRRSFIKGVLALPLACKLHSHTTLAPAVAIQEHFEKSPAFPNPFNTMQFKEGVLSDVQCVFPPEAHGRFPTQVQVPIQIEHGVPLTRELARKVADLTTSWMREHGFNSAYNIHTRQTIDIATMAYRYNMVVTCT